ncbi:MAG: DNA-binding HxlR family transcriptional regulator [Candidatus Aldehydirespiratoraceae bacterium]|jgi:DNA-binding HxlR family transcriptional regulator
MTAKRHYNLLCPIARALDAVGDRWTLLILRDLHAAPARYQELQEGLGIATNLLSTRLTELTESGLICQPSERGAYELTDIGRGTDQILWELARFGGQLDRAPDPREPGNLRTLALPLKIVLGAVPNRPDLTVRLHIDDNVLTIISTRDTLDVRYGDTSEPVNLVLQTSYEAFLDVAEGLMPPDEFVTRHVEIIEGPHNAGAFFELIGAAIALQR